MAKRTPPPGTLRVKTYLVWKHILHTSLQNHTCHYEISSQVTKAHLETLFGPLDYEVEEEDDYFGPEIDIECDTQIGTNKNFKCAKCDFETDMKHCLKQHLMGKHFNMIAFIAWCPLG